MKKRGIKKLNLRRETLGALNATPAGAAAPAQTLPKTTGTTLTAPPDTATQLNPSFHFTECHSCYPCVTNVPKQ